MVIEKFVVSFEVLEHSEEQRPERIDECDI